MTKLLALVLIFAAGPAVAQVSRFPPPPPPSLDGPYVGGGLGYSQAKKGCLDLLSGGGRTCDDKDMAWGGYAGYRFMRFLAAEAAYHDLGRVTATGPGSTESVHGVVMDLTGLGILQLDEHFGAFLRIGVYRATLDTSVRGINDHTNGNITYGAGLQWDRVMFGGLGVRFDWQRYKKVGGDDTPYGSNNYDVLNASLFWRFH